MRTRRLVWIAGAVLLLSACASPKYVLHWREPTGFLDLSPPQENTPIPSVDGVALLYDRSPWVVYESALPDGSAWVHTAIVMKNISRKTHHILSRMVRLESSGGLAAHAVYDSADRVQEREKVEPGILYRQTVKFQIPKPAVEEHGDHVKPMRLLVTLESGAILEQRYWLWRE